MAEATENHISASATHDEENSAEEKKLPDAEKESLEKATENDAKPSEELPVPAQEPVAEKTTATEEHGIDDKHEKKASGDEDSKPQESAMEIDGNKEPETQPENSKEGQPETAADAENLEAEKPEESHPAKGQKKRKGRSTGSKAKEEKKPEEKKPKVERASADKPQVTRRRKKVEEEQEEDEDDRDLTEEEEKYMEIWKEVYLVGTELDQYNDVFKINWEFYTLAHELAEGQLSAKDPERGDQTVYLFGTTEPQLVQLSRKGDEKPKVTHVPVIVAVRSTRPPPSEVGIKSVQMAEEKIVPMKDLKMDWVRHVDVTADASKKKRHKKGEAAEKSRDIVILKCVQRRAPIRQMKEETVKKFEYCLPYIFLPHLHQDNEEVDSVVQVLRTIDGKGLHLEYDWKMDDLEEFVAETLKSEEMPAEKAEEVKAAIQEEVKAAKDRIRKEREEKKQRLEAVPADQKEAYEHMLVMKFYPSNKFPDVSQLKSKFINRYYGNAQQVL